MTNIFLLLFIIIIQSNVKLGICLAKKIKRVLSNDDFV